MGHYSQQKGPEFYLGLGIWAVEIPIAYNLWIYSDKPGMGPEVTATSLSVSAVLFVLYIVGFFAANGLFEKQVRIASPLNGLLLCGVSAVALSLFFFLGMVGLLVTTFVTQLPRFVQRKQAIVAAIVLPLLCVIFDNMLGKPFEYSSIFLFGAVNVLAVMTSYGVLAERRAKLESERLVRELSATQILLAASIRQEERLRIARDLHDAIGHQLTALNLQLEVASHTIESDKQQHIRNAQSISHDLLSDVRDTVSHIRKEQELFLEPALERLTKGVVGLDVTLELNLPDGEVDALHAEVVIRCVQEALTNIAKHSNANLCTIGLSNCGQRLELDIRDNGVVLHNFKLGNGLTGMVERVRDLDGTASFDGSTTGFRLLITLPCD